jgi:hypothetical protein
VVGDPTVRVPLRAPPARWWWLAPAGGLAVIIAIASARTRRSNGRR